MKLIQFIFALVFIAFNEIIKFCIKRPGISLLLIFVLWVNSLPLPDEKIVIVKQDSLSQIERTLTTQQSLAICGGKFVNPDSGWTGGYRKSIDQNPLDRGPDRNPYAGPRYAGDNNDFSSSGSGNGNNNPWENEDIPPKSDWKPDKDYWKKFHPDYEKKKRMKSVKLPKKIKVVMMTY